MKNTLIAVSVMLAVVSVGSMAQADENNSTGLNFQTEVGASIGSLFGDSAKEENGIERKSKMDENLFIQTTDANSGFGARLGYTHFGDLKDNNSKISDMQKKHEEILAEISRDSDDYNTDNRAVNNALEIQEGIQSQIKSTEEEIFDDQQRLKDKDMDNPKNRKKLEDDISYLQYKSHDYNRQTDIIKEAQDTLNDDKDALQQKIKDGAYTQSKYVVKTITSTIDLEAAKQFKVAPKLTITGLAGAAYANYTEDHLEKTTIDKTHQSYYNFVSSDKKHTFLPEAGVEVGYDITDNVMATVGYNHIFSRDDIKSVDTANIGLAVTFS